MSPEQVLKPDLLLRLRCAVGHLQAVAEMIEMDAPCEKTLHQLHAVQAALTKIQLLLIQGEAVDCISALQEQADHACPEEVSARLKQLIRYSPQLS